MSTARTKDRKTTNPAQKAIEPADTREARFGLDGGGAQRSRRKTESQAPTEVADEVVTCFISGQVVPKSAASLVKLGPGQRVWMAHELISDREREKQSNSR